MSYWRNRRSINERYRKGLGIKPANYVKYTWTLIEVGMQYSFVGRGGVSQFSYDFSFSCMVCFLPTMVLAIYLLSALSTCSWLDIFLISQWNEPMHDVIVFMLSDVGLPVLSKSWFAVALMPTTAEVSCFTVPWSLPMSCTRIHAMRPIRRQLTVAPANYSFYAKFTVLLH